MKKVEYRWINMLISDLKNRKSVDYWEKKHEPLWYNRHNFIF